MKAILRRVQQFDLAAFWQRHPLLRDVLLWTLPALIIGAVLRLLFLAYSPHAYWGSDSRSYYSFAQKLLTDGYISLDEKRRFLYPIFLVPVHWLPGNFLQGLAWVQHACGLLSLLPLAYALRKTLIHWRFWVPCITIIYGTMPMILWYEHELLGETIFFAALAWAFGGWAAWAGTKGRAHFWWFFVPLAIFLLVKPSGRFLLPGLLLALLLSGLWRSFRPAQAVALVLLLASTLFVGSKRQGAWLLYTASFPLTQLDTPPHSNLKAEVRDLVEPLRLKLDYYYENDDEPFEFLERPSRAPHRVEWQKLQADRELRTSVYTDLALEGIWAEPLQFFSFGWQRLLASANPSQFNLRRFEPEHFPSRFQEFYEEARKDDSPRAPIRMLFDIPERQPLPTFQEFRQRLSPDPNGSEAKFLSAWSHGFHSMSSVLVTPPGRSVLESRPTPLGWLLIAGLVLSLTPPYFRTYGVWTLAAISYLFGVFLASQANARYFAPALPLLVPLLVLPLEVIFRAWQCGLCKRKENEDRLVLAAGN